MPEVSLEQRRADYQAAEARAEKAAAEYLEARTRGFGLAVIQGEGRRLEEAQNDLRRAKRRLEETERRLAKKEATK